MLMFVRTVDFCVCLLINTLNILGTFTEFPIYMMVSLIRAFAVHM